MCAICFVKRENSRTSTRFESPVDVRYLFLYLLARKSQHASSHYTTDSIRRSMCDICVISWPENHNMHHRTSTDSIHQSMCDICFCISWPENHNMHHRTSTRFESPVDVRYLRFYLLASENHNMHHRTSIDSIIQSMCDICFVSLGQRKSQHASSHIDRFDSPVDVRYLFLYLLARKTTNSSQIDPIRITIDVRYLFLYLLARKSQHASSHIDPIRITSRCAISVFVSLDKRKSQHA